MDSDETQTSDPVPDEVEIEHERTVDRDALVALFQDLAVALDHERPLHFLDNDDQTVSVTIPSHVDLEIEVEREYESVAEDADKDEDAAGDADTDTETDAPTEADDTDTPHTVTNELEIELEWDEPVDDLSVRVESLEAAEETEDEKEEGAEQERESEPESVVLSPTEATGSPDDSEAIDETGSESTAERSRTSRFEVYQDRADEWRWRLVHWNGNIIADSGEGYTSRANAERAVRGVRRAVPTATVVETDE
ncbi:hypothetical protein C482_00335 [Natrialba chahannaoensis JCM 10990]|uniref:Uncharacterized protein n=1 Tax=Natrialba chahannaoensis JCM 10990 TaxID=1227492 RepID=M0B7H1_9EURY|nr:amphi-Trp domain-containing protein [Natrialba chahannaoensis]ELZ06223.1 hypothetical protein C482_00335 [Natrialba chahannaoensis JCM 10990]